MPLQVPVTQTGLEASIQQAMRNAGRNAQINLGTNSRQINALAQPLGRITGQADEFTKSMEAANARVFAFGASVGIINGVTKAFGALVRNTIEVEKSLVEINTVLNTSGDSLQKFGNKLFDVAKTTGQTFDVVAKGALELARQGLSTEETLKRINDALILSRLSGLDAQQSVEGLTAAFNSFKETGITTSEILNKLVVVSQKYSVSERDLIEGLKRSASVADQAGVSFDELVGIITTVQERTARGGAVIGNAFKTIFARIQDTGALQDLANLGVQVTDLQGKILPATQILQNLAREFNNLSQVEQADIAKKLGGVYQLSNLLAAVKDLSSEQSKYNDIVRLSAGATNEAYKKNAALNETLATLINKVTLSAQQLGATLGEIGIADGLKKVLDFINYIFEGFQKILGEESALGTLFKGLAKGIGSVLAGPGLAIFAAIIGKLSIQLAGFGIDALKSFFKINQSAKEIQNIEKSIATALGSNLGLQRQLFALEGNRAAQLKLMTDAIVQQEAVMRRMSATAGSLAGSLYQQGVRSVGGQGLRVPKAAGGYMPAVAGEASDIRRGVGGARAGDKPVVIPNFAFGGGKKGTMVAHTGEYIVPNFARGGSAIFNRDMIASMGLPSGAKKIGAAGGFIPNFANIATETSRVNLNSIIANKSGQRSEADVAAAKKRLVELENKKQAKEQSRLVLDASKFALLVPAIGENNQNGENFSGSFKKGSSSIPYQLKNLKIRGPQVPKAIDQAADPNDEYLKNNIENSIASDSAKYANLLGKPAKKITKVDVLRLFQTNKGSKGAISSAVGAGFEAATMAAIKTSNFTDDITAKLNKAGGDFDVRGATDDINTLFGLKSIRTMDFKSSRSPGNIDSFAKKLYNELPAALSAKVSKAAGGFIPNFADPLKEAIGREMSAGVPASQIYVDQNSSLKNPMNPMGLMVANRRDEPAGGMQGINRARKEGANPMMYGAAGGFIPNYAPPIGEVTRQDLGRTKISDQSIQSFNESLKEISVSLRKGSVSFTDAINKVSQLSSSTGSTTTQVARLRTAGEGLVTAYNNELQARNARAKELKQERSERQSGNNSKNPRDLLGVVFAVQTGLSLFAGATSDATSGVGRFTNAVSSIASAATTAKLVGEGLSGLAKEGSSASKVLGKLGTYGAILASGYELYKQLFVQPTKEGGQAVAKFSDAVNQAGISIDNLSKSAQQQSLQNAEGYLKRMGFGASMSDDIIGRAYKDPETQKMLANAMLISGISEKDLTEKLVAGGAIKRKEMVGENGESIPVFGQGNKMGVAYEYYGENLDKTRKVLADITAMPEKMIDGKINPEYEKRIKLLQKLKEKQDELNEDISEPQKIAEAAKASSKQLEQTIRNIQIESNLRKKLFQQTEKANSKQIAADLDIANIKSDITLSELERNKLIGRRQFQLEKDLAILENQKSEMTEIANLAKQISAESISLAPENKAAASLQAEDAIKALSGQKIGLDTNVRDMLKSMSITVDLIKDDTDFKKILDAALKIQDTAAKTTQEFNQQNSLKERSLSLSEAEAQVNENNSRVFERMQNSLSAMADDRSILARRLGYQSEIVGAERDLKLAQLENSNPSMPPSQRIAQQRSIEREAFDKQLQLNTQKSITEAEADFIRNSKIQDNIQALQDNNIALKENTNALLQVKVNEPSPFAKAFLEEAPAKNNFYKNDLNYIAENGANVAKLNPQLAANLEKFAKAFYDKFGEELQVSGSRSAFRTIQESADIRAKAIQERGLAYALKYTATPGRSQHNFGNAVDFSKSQINRAVSSGMRLEDYGLTRPMSWEDWHVELLGARSKGVSGVNTNRAPYTTAALNASFVSPENQMKKGRELASLATSDEILQKAREYTKELGLQETAAESVAIQIKDFALRIKEVGEEKAFEEKMQKIKEDTQAISDNIKSIAELEKIDLQKQLAGLTESPITFKEGMENGFLSLKAQQAQFAYNLGKEIPKMFSDGITGAIMSAVEGTSSLKDALMNAAYEFLKAFNQRMIGNLADRLVSGLGNFAMSSFSNGGSVPKYASGGMINGGSGSKDDVPAMLMGGEYVINKKAAQKYGPDFLHAINNGTLGGYAKGGSVKKFADQTGEGGYFLPGLYGNESVASQQGLFDFATQNYTSGARDVISSGENYASINLETESFRLTQRGRENNPMFAATQSAKEQALGLVFQEAENWEKYREAVEEAKRQEKERQKAIRKQLLISAAMAVGSAVAGPVLGAAASGFKAAFGASSAANNGFLTNLGAGLKGIFTGGQLAGSTLTQNVGGLNNLFASLGKGLTGNFAEAGNLFKLSQIGSADQLQKAFAGSITSKSNFSNYLTDNGYIPQATIVNEGGIGINGTNNWFSNIFGGVKRFLGLGQGRDIDENGFESTAIDNPAVGMSRQELLELTQDPLMRDIYNQNPAEWKRRATGGIIPSTSGIDTVPAMLSGGEFIMNRAATQNIGSGNLQALNSGGGSVVTEEKTEELNDKLISKLDELIQASISKSSVGEININVDSSGKSKESSSNVESGGQSQQLARSIRDMVVKVIQDEQRLGGLLR